MKQASQMWSAVRRPGTSQRYLTQVLLWHTRYVYAPLNPKPNSLGIRFRYGLLAVYICETRRSTGGSGRSGQGRWAVGQAG